MRGSALTSTDVGCARGGAAAAGEPVTDGLGGGSSCAGGGIPGRETAVKAPSRALPRWGPAAGPGGGSSLPCGGIGGQRQHPRPCGNIEPAAV